MQGGPVPYVGSLVPDYVPRAYCMLRLGGFPHRIPDTFAGEATSSLPPMESFCLLLFPGGWQPPHNVAGAAHSAGLSLLEPVLEYCCPPLCLQVLLPDILWYFSNSLAWVLVQNKHSKNIEWMAVNKSLGLQVGCYIDVILCCLFLKNVSYFAIKGSLVWWLKSQTLDSERLGFESQLCHS